MNRRNFLEAAGAGLAALHIQALTGCSTSAVPAVGATGVGMCDWNLGEYPNPDLISLAQEAHLEGIQVSIGTRPDNIPLREREVRRKYLELGRKHGITFHSVAAGSILNSIPLATEPQSAVYVIDAIEAAAVLGAGNILLAFFGRGDLRKRDEEGNLIERQEGEFKSYALNDENVTRVVEALRQIVPRAKDAGVIIGIENTLTAKQNLQIIDRIGSDIAQVYYDVGNSWGSGYNVPGEIRMLGNDMICEVHLKDWNTSVLGSDEGMVDMAACARALDDIGYNKWLVLETSGRRDRFLEDTRANVAFVKETFVMA